MTHLPPLLTLSTTLLDNAHGWPLADAALLAGRQDRDNTPAFLLACPALPDCLMRLPHPCFVPLQPMKHWYKPLAFYAAMEAAALLCRVALHAAGFQRHVWMGLAYYTRNMPAQQIRPSTDLPAGFYRSGSGMHVHQHQSARAAARAHNSRSSSQEVPLVLLHGIGMGLVPYISMLFNMAATGEAGHKHVRVRVRMQLLGGCAWSHNVSHDSGYTRRCRWAVWLDSTAST